MATIKQKKVAEILLENPGKSISSAMREAGYAEATAKNPKELTSSEGWQEYLRKFLPVEEAIDTTRQALKATKPFSSHTEADRDVPDWQARLKATEQTYRLHGRFNDKTQVEVSAPQPILGILLGGSHTILDHNINQENTQINQEN